MWSTAWPARTFNRRSRYTDSLVLNFLGISASFEHYSARIKWSLAGGDVLFGECETFIWAAGSGRTEGATVECRVLADRPHRGRLLVVWASEGARRRAGTGGDDTASE